jgi:hypothetical protein
MVKKDFVGQSLPDLHSPFPLKDNTSSYHRSLSVSSSCFGAHAFIWPSLSFTTKASILCRARHQPRLHITIANLHCPRFAPATEREMCQYLDLVTLREFKDMVKKDFVGQGPYPTYALPSPSKTTPPPTMNPFPSPPAALVPMPSYGHRYPSPPKPAFPSYSAGPAISHTFMILPTSFSLSQCVHAR